MPMMRHVYGRVECYQGGELHPDDGTIHGGKLVHAGPNVVLNNLYSRQGFWIASNVQNGGIAIPGPGYIGVGNTVFTITNPTPQDTVMGMELKRKPITSSIVQGLYTVRFFVAINSVEANAVLTEVGLFDAPGYAGTVTSAVAGPPGTLTDTGAAFPITGFGLVGRTCYVYGKTGNTGYSSIYFQQAIITANTATQVTVASWPSFTPDSTSLYCMGGVAAGEYMFARTKITAVTKIAGNGLNILWILTEATP